jgi:hypothetical protein
MAKKIIFTFLILIIAIILGINTIPMSRCEGMCNGLEPIIVIFISMPIWLVLTITVLLQAKNKIKSVIFYLLSLGFSIFCSTFVLNPVREFTVITGFQYFPEIIAGLLVLSISLFCFHLIWGDKISKLIIFTASIYLFVSIFGFSLLARFGNEYYNYNTCPKINPTINELVSKLENYSEKKEFLDFHFGLEKIKCITHNSFQADVKLYASDSTGQNIFESKSVDGVKLFQLQGLSSSDILVQAFGSDQRFSNLIYYLQVFADDGNQVISYKPESYSANVEPNGGMGYDSVGYIDIGCEKTTQKVDKSDPTNPNLISTTKIRDFEYLKKTDDKVFKCY